MKKSDTIAARFAFIRHATAAIDWFRNQGIAPDAIDALAVPPSGRPRPPQPGDNRRSDLGWIVALDLKRANITRAEAVAAMRREGGKLLSRMP